MKLKRMTIKRKLDKTGEPVTSNNQYLSRVTTSLTKNVQVGGNSHKLRTKQPSITYIIRVRIVVSRISPNLVKDGLSQIQINSSIM